ncbi:alpha/beta hydrolase [Microbacterium protaetiae]|uniref:Alpha/beta hydrolase n=1 Tax=Microbacterium protaetiae TaxID=2509458 RepID=A0A4P6E925_9MICO|nr:alpha/beta hydrolase [Microbacterium protaetiae]QAY58580.1 alpha/beta hydrolase [Microbacterium protaetiae]
MTTNSTLIITTTDGEIPVTVDDRGSGRAVLLLHGGAGPASVTGFAELLADRAGARVITPTHPGFGGTPRPTALATVAGLARLYAGLLDALDLEEVTVIGNSLGGWIAAELALRHSPRVSRVALVDAVGIESAQHPVADFFALTPAQIAQRSYNDPTKAVIPDPATLPPAAQQIVLGNRDALAVYGGVMMDAALADRLGSIDVPALVVWGEADRIADPDYGRAYAAAIPGARFTLLERTGHVPQLETPELLWDALREFVA